MRWPVKPEKTARYRPNTPKFSKQTDEVSAPSVKKDTSLGKSGSNPPLRAKIFSMVKIKEEELISLIELCLYDISPQILIGKKNREIKKLKEEVKTLKDKYEKTI